MAKEVAAIYPGSFDPVTNGHVDIIGRSQGIFDRVIVAVLVNIEKTPFFTTDERLEMLQEVTRKWDNVQIETFQGLLVNYAVAQKAQIYPVFVFFLFRKSSTTEGTIPSTEPPNKNISFTNLELRYVYSSAGTMNTVSIPGCIRRFMSAI